jgi:hypothetical protein
VHLPKLFAVLQNTFGVDIDDDALSAKSLRGLADQLGVLASRRVDTDFVAPGLQQLPNIVEGSNTPPNRQWHEDLLGGPTHDIQHNPSIFVTGCDIEKYEFVSTFLFVSLRDLHGVAGIA